MYDKTVQKYQMSLGKIETNSTLMAGNLTIELVTKPLASDSVMSSTEQ